MKYHSFPGTDLSVSQLCFGCWGITSDSHWGDRREEDSLDAMRAAIECGVNFFDTAPMYADGASEIMLGEFLKQQGLRNKVVIADKVSPSKMDAAGVIEECEQSLKRLQTNVIDLYQTHWTSTDVPLEETWHAMVKLKEQGKVRQIGVCNAGVQDLATVIGIEKPMTDQLPYNLISRSIEYEIQPTCVDQKIGLLVYSPLLHGMLAGKYSNADEVPDGRARSRHFSRDRAQTRHGEDGCELETFQAIASIRDLAKELDCTMADLALAWLLARPGVACVIAGARNSKQVRENVAQFGTPIDAEVMKRLDDATEPVKVALGHNPDLWDGSGSGRYH